MKIPEELRLLRPDEIIKFFPENTLVSIVMRLTYGCANPSDVYENIKRIKE